MPSASPGAGSRRNEGADDRSRSGKPPGRKPAAKAKATSRTTGPAAKAKLTPTAKAEAAGRGRDRRSGATGSAPVPRGPDPGPPGFGPAPPGFGPAPPGFGPAPPGFVGPGRMGRGRRRLDLYDRRAQRAHERWPVVARLVAGLLGHPDALLALLGETQPVEREGRVLNRGLQALVAVVNRFGGPAPSAPADLPDPTVMRRSFRHALRAIMPVRTDVHVSGRAVPGPDGAPPLGIRIYRRFGSGLTDGPGTRRLLPAIVYFHGGGWVSGDLDSHDGLCRMVAVASECLVVSVDYRLAPEHPFPAAVDDALAAYAWVHAHADQLGADPGRIGVMGDSAGANLAAVVAQVTRAGAAGTAMPPPAAQGLVCPVLDARLGSESMRTFGEGFIFTRTVMQYYRDHYLPVPSDWANPLASPLLNEDLGGLPPALVVTAGFDPLADDGAHYAEALRRADVPVDHRRYDDQTHDFVLIGVVPDSLALTVEVGESMGRLVRHSAPAPPIPPTGPAPPPPAAG